MLQANEGQEWINSDHVQPGHLITMTKLIQLWTVDAKRAVDGPEVKLGGSE